MRHTWHPSQIGRSRERFADSFRGWFGRFGSVTHFIVWLTALVFIAQLACKLFRLDFAGEDGTPVGVVQFIFGLNAARVAHGFVWQPLTYLLVHDGIWHIIFNLLMLWWFGREVESFIGPKAFTRLYLLAGGFGGAFWLVCNLAEHSPLVGASAAVLGCVIAFSTLFPERELTFLIFFVLPVTLRAKYIALIAIAVDLVPVLTHQTSNIAHLAHLGGAAVGYVFIKALGYGTTPRWLQWLQTTQPRRYPKSTSSPTTREDFIRTEIDPILDKISREGMQSLTRQERKTLESAKDLLQKKRQ
ncbi:MAG: rhomboid family intramembrane serine protease [Verrucomicrobiota bacterium]|jgi:membrane associated rhomboid family serine protease